MHLAPQGVVEMLSLPLLEHPACCHREAGGKTAGLSQPSRCASCHLDLLQQEMRNHLREDVLQHSINLKQPRTEGEWWAKIKHTENIQY